MGRLQLCAFTIAALLRATHNVHSHDMTSWKSLFSRHPVTDIERHIYRQDCRLNRKSLLKVRPPFGCYCNQIIGMFNSACSGVSEGLFDHTFKIL